MTLIDFVSYTLTYTSSPLPSPVLLYPYIYRHIHHHHQPLSPSLPFYPGVPGVFSDFQLSDLARAVADRQTAAKQSVPHYYLSVELNLSKLMALREQLNQGTGGGGKGGNGGDVSVLDLMVKASALAMKQVCCPYSYLSSCCNSYIALLLSPLTTQLPLSLISLILLLPFSFPSFSLLLLLLLLLVLPPM